MSLKLQQLKLQTFRNYESLHLENFGDLVIFVGPNAIGKTNIVESIRLLSGVSPLRPAKTEEYILDGYTQAKVDLSVEGDNRKLALSLSVEPGKKKYFLNEKSKSFSDIRGLIPSVVFTPDDLMLIKGSHKQRRSALDSLGYQVNANYAAIYKDFEQILSQRNKLLKEEVNIAFLESINSVFVTCASQLFCYRYRLFKVLLPYIKQFYSEITDGKEECDARYFASWDLTTPVISCEKEQVKECLSNSLSELLYKEYDKKHSLLGPQLDHIIFYINGKDASIFGSQGQQRSLVLAWKLAESAVIEQMLSQKPILLLDDVMSELDSKRRNKLTQFALETTQTFVTTTTLDYFSDELLSKAKVIKLPLATEREKM